MRNFFEFFSFLNLPPARLKAKHRRREGIGKVGGQPYLSEAWEEKFKELVGGATQEGACVDVARAPALLLGLKREELCKLGKPSHSVKPPSLNTIKNICKRRGIRIVKKPDMSTVHRQEGETNTLEPSPSPLTLGQAESSVLNFISAGAAALAVTTVREGPAVPPELLFNIDSTGNCLVKQGHQILVDYDVARALHGQHKGAKMVCKKEKRRFSHLFAVVSASGRTLCFIAFVQDNALSAITLRLVSAPHMFPSSQDSCRAKTSCG